MEAQLLRGKAEISKAKQQQRELKRTRLRLEEQKKMGEDAYPGVATERKCRKINKRWTETC